MVDSLAEKVLAAVASVKRISPEQVALESSLQELGFDSLDTTVLLFELEKRLQVSIPDEAARTVRTVRDIVEGVAKLTATPSLDRAARGGDS